MALDDFARKRLGERLKEGSEDLYLDAIRKRQLDAAVQARLTENVREIMDGMVRDGIMERVSGGRYILTDPDGEIRRAGSKPVPTTAEETVRQAFPLAFPSHPYSRWEDAMIEQIRLHEYTSTHEGRRYVDFFRTT